MEENDAELDLNRTLFVLANKGRYDLKDHCLFLYFWNKLQTIEGLRTPRHFLSETEAGSYLDILSREYTFRAWRMLPQRFQLPIIRECSSARH
jgi:hypothetical protein